MTALPIWALLPCSATPALCCWAKYRQLASSCWNTSKGLPGAGITATRGPIGACAQPASSATVVASAMAALACFKTLPP